MDNQENTGGAGQDTRKLGDSLQDLFNNWQQQYAQEETDNIPHDDIAAAYNQWTNQAPPRQQQAAIQHAFSQVSKTQRANIATDLIGMLTQSGLNPLDAGVRTTNPQQMSPQDLARLTTYAQQQDPGIIRQLLSNPLVGMAISAALSYALQRFLGGTQGYNQPAPPSPYLQPQQPQTGGGLGGLIGQFLGGGSDPTPQPVPQAPQQGGGLLDLFGQLLGGGQSDQGQTGTPPTYTPPGDNPLDVTRRR